jgi:AhpD family alkylhydroperoxidase
MPRIAPISDKQAGPLLRQVFRIARRKVGRVPDSLRVSANDGWSLGGQIAFELAVERFREVDHDLLELAQLKAATLTGCPFCMDIGSWLARAAGITEQQLRELPRHAESEHFNAVEKVVLDYAVAMTRTPVEVDDDLFARLREHFDERAIAQLTAAIAWENFRGRFNHALGIGAQGFSEGAFCAVPEPYPSLPDQDPAGSLDPVRASRYM